MHARTVLLDLDGTLLDSNALHVEAFREAFATVGSPIAPDRIATEIGKGGDNVVPSILGVESDHRVGEAVRSLYKQQYRELLRKRRPRLFPHGLDLIHTLHRRDLKVALATSSGSDQLDLVTEVTGTDLRKLVDAATTSSDAETSKPAPDLWLVAAQKLGLHPAECVAVGDTLHDHTSARKAGVTSIALATWRATGSDHDLRRAGARVVYEDAGDLLQHLDEALRICAPMKLNLSLETLDRFLAPAFDAARKNLEEGGAPIASALFDAGGRLLATGVNRSHLTHNGIDHAEITTLHNATGRFNPAGKDVLLACTLEPCVMCTGAAMETGVDTLLFALKAPADNGSTRVIPPESPESLCPRAVYHPARRDEARQLFQNFLARTKDPAQIAFTRQLLAIS